MSVRKRVASIINSRNFDITMIILTALYSIVILVEFAID